MKLTHLFNAQTPSPPHRTHCLSVHSTCAPHHPFLFEWEHLPMRTPLEIIHTHQSHKHTNHAHTPITLTDQAHTHQAHTMHTSVLMMVAGCGCSGSSEQHLKGMASWAFKRGAATSASAALSTAGLMSLFLSVTHAATHSANHSLTCHSGAHSMLIHSVNHSAQSLIHSLNHSL